MGYLRSGCPPYGLSCQVRETPEKQAVNIDFPSGRIDDTQYAVPTDTFTDIANPAAATFGTADATVDVPAQELPSYLGGVGPAALERFLGKCQGHANARRLRES